MPFFLGTFFFCATLAPDGFREFPWKLEDKHLKTVGLLQKKRTWRWLRTSINSTGLTYSTEEVHIQKYLSLKTQSFPPPRDEQKKKITSVLSFVRTHDIRRVDLYLFIFTITWSSPRCAQDKYKKISSC